MFTGEYGVTLDETCRISLPRNLRDELKTNTVYMCRGEEGCLWLFTDERWVRLVESVVTSTNPDSKDNISNPFFQEGRLVSRRILGTGQKLDIDKQGRVVVPPSLRDFAGLSKDCIVLGQFDYIEVWNKDHYDAYLKASEEEYRAASRELGARIKNDGEPGNYGHSSHSGPSRRDNTLSCSEGKE